MKLVAIIFILSTITAMAQVLPQLSSNVLARLASHTNAPPPPPPPPFITVTAHPMSAHIWQSQDLKHWQENKTNRVTVINTGYGYFKASDSPQALVTFQPQDASAASFNIIETSDELPKGAFLTVPVLVTNAIIAMATNSVMMPLFAGTNFFWVNETDAHGDISQFPPGAPPFMSATNPVIGITTGTNAPL